MANSCVLIEFPKEIDHNRKDCPMNCTPGVFCKDCYEATYNGLLLTPDIMGTRIKVSEEKALIVIATEGNSDACSWEDDKVIFSLIESIGDNFTTGVPWYETYYSTGDGDENPGEAHDVVAAAAQGADYEDDADSAQCKRQRVQ